MPYSETEAALGRRAGNGFSFVLLAMVLAISDYTIADAVIPALAQDLGLSVAELGLGFTAYFATAATFLVLFGRLGDVIGRRRIMLVGVALFAAGSIVSGLAWNQASFFTGRILAGLALAAILPTGLGVLHALFPSAGPARERAFAWWAMAIGAAAVVGPLIGGLAAAMLHWRWAFLGAVPLGVVAALGIRARVVENQRRSLAGVDAVGALLLAVAAGSLAMAVDLGGQGPAPSAVITLTIGIVAAAAFLVVSRRRVRRGREVIAPPHLFGYRSFRSATFSSAFMSVGDTGFQLVLPLMAGIVIGTSQLGIGVLLACYGAGAMVGGPAAAGLNRYVDDRRAAILALLALPLLLLAMLPLLSKGAPIAGIGALLAGYGFAWSIAYARLVNLSYQEVPEADSAVAGGVQSAMRLFAGAIGAAILTAVFGGVAAGHINSDSLHAVPSHQRLQPSSNQRVLQPIPPASEISDAYSAAARAAIVTAAGITALALVFAVRIPARIPAAVKS